VLQAFLDDIVAHPDDPPWQILADWLEDQADPRAELVRLTWSLQSEPDHTDFAARQARVQALLAGGMVPVRPRRTLAGIELTWISPGTFLMGSPPDEAERPKNERQHQVRLTAGFWMGVTPVTQGQWQSVMGNNPSYFARTGGGKAKVKAISDADLARLPVESVSWDDAQEFCGKLRAETGERVSLPSEAQWEYACRAGTTTPFHFGAVLNGAAANCNGKYPFGTKKKGAYLKRTSVVGSYPPNAWGLCDLPGNVCEWCQDRYVKDYQNLPGTDPLLEQENAPWRVLRSGSWDNAAQCCRSAYRNYVRAVNRSGDWGFRVAVTLP
jgi:uncharacterized protein (TIGR02996 family)